MIQRRELPWRFGSSPIAVELGGQDDVVATAFDGLADDLLRLLVVGVAPGAEHHGAEAQLADGDAGASEQVMEGLLLIRRPVRLKRAAGR
jgi:hypothetical protein